ncbi:hypothetical protein [Paenibacillus koleovorans]|uniref:hypothetical protein n=1 Tax=Paenibacillus koleovorans TaxID=121608 RepID=UPI000FDC2DA9|nr:hypothetical protein [Paenibacillus koleovorans]
MLVLLTMGLLPIVSLVPVGVPSASATKPNCDSVTAAVYTTVYDTEAGTSTCLIANGGVLNLADVYSSPPLTAEYDLNIYNWSLRGQSAKVVDSQGLPRNSAATISEDGHAQLQDITVVHNELLFVVIGNNGDSDQMIVPFGYMEPTILYYQLKLSSADPDARLVSAVWGNTSRHVIQPVPNVYYFSTNESDDLEDIRDEVVYSVVESSDAGGGKKYFLSAVVQDESGSGWGRVIENTLNMAKPWEQTNVSFTIDGVNQSQVTAVHQQIIESNSSARYVIPYQPVNEYSASIEYFRNSESYASPMYQVIQVESSDAQYVFVNDQLSFSSSSSPTPHQVSRNVSEFKQIGFEVANEEVSNRIGLEFSSVISVNGVGYLKYEVSIDPRKQLHYLYEMYPESLSYAIGTYGVVRGDSFFRKQLYPATGVPVFVLGRKINTFEIGATNPYSSEYRLILRNTDGDSLTPSNNLPMLFELFRDQEKKLGPVSYSDFIYYISSSDESEYTVRMLYEGPASLDANVFDRASFQNVMTASIPLTIVQLQKVNENTGSPENANLHNVKVTLQAVNEDAISGYYNFISYYSDMTGKMILRGYGPGLWRAVTYEWYDSLAESPYIQINQVLINGTQYTPGSSSNTKTLKVVNRRISQDTTEFWNLKDIVRFSGKIESMQFDFNQDGTANAEDYKYLMQTIPPYLFRHTD